MTDKPIIDGRLYYESSDFVISSKIIRSKGHYFNPSMVNSISFKHIVNPLSSQLSNTLTASSIFATFFGFVALIIIELSVIDGFTNLTAAVALIFAVVCVLLIRKAIRAAREKRELEPYGWIGFDTSSGKVQELISTNLSEAERVRDALIQMIQDKNP